MVCSIDKCQVHAAADAAAAAITTECYTYYACREVMMTNAAKMSRTACKEFHSRTITMSLSAYSRFRHSTL